MYVRLEHNYQFNTICYKTHWMKPAVMRNAPLQYIITLFSIKESFYTQKVKKLSLWINYRIRVKGAEAEGGKNEYDTLMQAYSMLPNL